MNIFRTRTMGKIKNRICLPERMAMLLTASVCPFKTFSHFPKKNLNSSNIIIHTLQFSDRLWQSTVCPRSSDPFYIVTYYIKLVTTSWTEGRTREWERKDSNLLTYNFFNNE